MNIVQQISFSLLSGILLAMAIPNEFILFGSPFLGLLALIPHYISLNSCKTLRRSVLLCFIQCLVTHFLSSFWLGFFKDFAIFTLGASAFGTAGIHSAFGFFFFLPFFIKSDRDKKGFLSILNKTVSTKPFRIFWFSAVYTVWEFVKSIGFLGYPWGTVPMASWNLKTLIQITDITGVRGLTFLFSFFAATASEYILDAVKTDLKKAYFLNKHEIFCLLMLFVLPTIYGVFQYSKKRVPEKYVNAVLIQQNYNPWETTDDSQSISESEKLTLKGIAEFKTENKKCDIVVWSEAVLHYPFPMANEHYNTYPFPMPLRPFIASTETPTVIGAPYCLNQKEQDYANSAIYFDKDGNFVDWYGKTQLVPFAEYIPYTEYKFVRNILQKLLGFSHGWTPGNEYKVFTLPLSSAEKNAPEENKYVNFSVPICFEDAFGTVIRRLKMLGSEVFLNITDDSWSLTKSAEYQHFIVASFRSVEFRTTLVRSTNSGYTVVTDPAGRILKDLPLFEQSSLSYSIPVYKNVSTVYLAFGEWFPSAMAFFMIFVLICAIFDKNYAEFIKKSPFHFEKFTFNFDLYGFV